MILGNQVWQNALLQQFKQPLYILEFPDFGVIIASFTTTAQSVTVGGYGVVLYGVDGYGT